MGDNSEKNMGFCVDGSSDFRVEGKIQTEDRTGWQLRIDPDVERMNERV
jgi:hypothetical protein